MMQGNETDNVVGQQILCDCWDCQENIGSVEAVRAALVRAVEHAKVTLIELFIHEFSPQGVTAVAVIAESHIFIHTWPEKGYVALDAFTCGDTAMPELAVEVVRNAFAPKHFQILEIKRRASYL
jgi:S-adenosylmethionine decarboxylase proenzyme